MNVEFYQMLLLHLLWWSHGFRLLFSWCAVSLWLMCVNGITIVTLEWIKLDRGAWSFLCVVRFCLLLFCWGFLHLYSSELWHVIFFFGNVFVWLWYQVIGTSWNEFGDVLFSSGFRESLRMIGISSLYVRKFFPAKLFCLGLLFARSFLKLQIMF